MARVTSQLWVGALIRRAQSAGAFVTVLHKGNAEAGAVYVVVNDRSANVTLYGPALQGSYDEGPQDRKFEILLENSAEQDVQERIERERNFDPDLWAIEIEDRGGRSFVEVVDYPSA